MKVEDGTRLHISLGSGALITPQSASTLAGLTLILRLAEQTSDALISCNWGYVTLATTVSPYSSKDFTISRLRPSA
jgi:hypothetical protein